jgi:hypothetical protein
LRHVIPVIFPELLCDQASHFHQQHSIQTILSLSNIEDNSSIEDNTLISPSLSSNGESSILSTDSPRRGWDLEQWSDDEILQDLEDLHDLEFLVKSIVSGMTGGTTSI